MLKVLSVLIPRMQLLRGLVVGISSAECFPFSQSVSVAVAKLLVRKVCTYLLKLEKNEPREASMLGSKPTRPPACVMTNARNVEQMTR